MTFALVKKHVQSESSQGSRIGLAKEAHAEKFRSVGDERGFGIEMEFPLVKSGAYGFGQVISERQLKRIFRDMGSRDGWQRNPHGFGVEKGIDGYGGSIHAEFGVGTVEIALPKANGLDHANKMIAEFVTPLIKVAERSGAYVLGHGTQPVTQPGAALCLESIPRYKMMLDTWGSSYRIDQEGLTYGPTVNAALHFHVQTKDSEDAVRLANVYNGLRPELLALGANSSPVRGPHAGMADSRTTFYEDYLLERNLAIAPIFRDFDHYFEHLMSLPMDLLKREGEYYKVNEAVSLRDFMHRGIASASRDGVGSVFAVRFEEQDIEVMEGLVRADARLKSYTNTVEVRLFSEQASRSEVMGLGAVIRGLAENLDRAQELA
ncbi:MAG: hypothetical protein KGH62_04380, partial [Candidatus Micrarchaeota archaeon]|nr:hypothetical protein [Candidatus Micrarchaeota archaeon]